MTEFIRECQREWKRLHVPQGIADDMAAELTADLLTAEANGETIEDLLGDGVDARAFAETWARERGLLPPPRRKRLPRHQLLLGLAAVVLAAVITTATLTLVPRSKQEGSRGTTAVVLDVRRLRTDVAIRVLTQHGFKVVAMGRKSTSPPGSVTYQFPLPGSHVPAGALVTLLTAQTAHR